MTNDTVEYGLFPREQELLERQAEGETQDMRVLARTATMQGAALALMCEAFYRHLLTCEQGKPLLSRDEILRLLRAAIGHMRV